jgi:hypothetical protein
VREVLSGAATVRSREFVITLVAACCFAAANGYHRVEARKLTCEDKDARIDELSTQLRLRTAELEVNRGMLRAAKKKLEKCAE